MWLQGCDSKCEGCIPSGWPSCKAQGNLAYVADDGCTRLAGAAITQWLIVLRCALLARVRVFIGLLDNR
jgi:hypothetical protein